MSFFNIDASKQQKLWNKTNQQKDALTDVSNFFMRRHLNGN